MTTTMQVVQIIFQTVAILFMLTFMFIGIWSFILFIKMNKNQRIQNFLLEKINKSISAIELKTTNDSDLESALGFDYSILDNDFEDDNIIRIDENTK